MDFILIFCLFLFFISLLTPHCYHSLRTRVHHRSHVLTVGLSCCISSLLTLVSSVNLFNLMGIPWLVSILSPDWWSLYQYPSLIGGACF